MDHPTSPILLDTNALLWLLTAPHKLDQRTQRTIAQSSNVCCSSVSLWEIHLKRKASKLPFSTKDMYQQAMASGFTFINITVDHIMALDHIKLPQKDPFDHLLVAQAQQEKYLFLTSDQKILQSYPNLTLKINK